MEFKRVKKNKMTEKEEKALAVDLRKLWTLLSSALLKKSIIRDILIDQIIEKLQTLKQNG